jgi:hypothetical protein
MTFDPPSPPTNARFEGALFIHDECAGCGSPDAPFGYGVSIMKDRRYGMWYCKDCRPDREK